MTEENAKKLQNYKNEPETAFIIHDDKEREEILKALGVREDYTPTIIVVGLLLMVLVAIVQLFG